MSKMVHLAPIVLFVYNRPEHTRRTLEALATNPEAKDSILHVFADGPKEGAPQPDLEKIALVRSIVRRRPWCGQVITHFREANQGLAASITGGVTQILNKYGRVIVLEDDIVVTPEFLRYMNDALEIYEKDDRVMHVGAFVPPCRRWLPRRGTFVSNFMSCWGWGTWKTAWQNVVWEPRKLLCDLEREGRISRFDLGTKGFFSGQLRDLIEGRKKTWAVMWYASVFLMNGYCLYPGRTLVENIGFDGTGTNCEARSGPATDVGGASSLRVVRKRRLISVVGNVRFALFFRYAPGLSIADIMLIVLGNIKHRLVIRLRRL